MAYYEFSQTLLPDNAKEPSLPNNLPIAGGRKNRWIHAVLMALARGKMQTTLSRIWTRVTDSIFNGDNRYAKNTSNMSLCQT